MKIVLIICIVLFLIEYFNYIPINKKNNKMKIYKQKPVDLVRLQISQQGTETEYLTLVETNVQEFKKWFIELIDKNVKSSPFEKKRITKVYIREAIGGKNGKSISASFRGLTPRETIELIKNNLHD